MTYLTHDHAPPPAHILADGLRHPVAPLIRREDIHRLSQLGVLRHITAEGPAPLGYGPWQLAEDARGPHYYREPAGTAEERQAAVEAQAAAERESYLDELQCTRVQGRRALNQAGLFEAYEAAVESARPTMTRDQLFFVDEVPTWRYRDPILQSFGAALGMDDVQMIQLIELARTL
jgi:hypothetical protein